MTRLLIFTCFFASGACGLAYEVLWTRMLTLVFGTTVYSTSVVLTVFMAGLGLGAALGGRYADRLRNPLRAYGILEVAIGLYCFFTPSLVRGIEALYVGWAVPTAPTAMLALRAGLSFLALIPPTVLMGATLPMLSRFFVQRLEAVGHEVGQLYGINTAGAAFGCFAAGFLAVPTLGVNGTIW
ncbi:MAG: spermidine synthase, partial [Planctomycetes bacterium]|nr:spermidine synthase [Planctomycetota bacterium]